MRSGRGCGCSDDQDRDTNGVGPVQPWLACGVAPTYDVILFGPTGVTGREVARYLTSRAPALGLRWAAAGRDRARIDDALGAVGATPDEILLADTTDEPSIDAMVGRARVVANLVGPYPRYGEPVHRACARAGVHQLDLTGEIDWVREMIDRYDAVAAASGAAIVPSAGFESLPFDLAAWLAATVAFERHGDSVVDVDAAVAMTTTARMSGIADAVSGGTFASMVEMIRRASGRPADPHAIDPAGPTTPSRFDLGARRHAGTGAWLAPLFPTPFLNPPVVHRSAALLRADGDPVFAPTFRYREGTVTASMVPGPDLPGVAPTVSALLAAGQQLLAGAGRPPGPSASGSPTRWPGSGRSRATVPDRRRWMPGPTASTCGPPRRRAGRPTSSSRPPAIPGTSPRRPSSARPRSPSPRWPRPAPATAPPRRCSASTTSIASPTPG